VLGIGCARANFDETALRQRFPGLAQLSGERLRETTPYLLPSSGVVTLFLCRFTTELPVLVSLPGDASEREIRALRGALHAMQEAGLGIRFQEVEPARASITIRLVDEPPEPGAGRVMADCRVDPAALEPSSVDVLPAELEHADVRIARRKPPDWRGERLEPSLGELTGAALHELGHALGFQGHTSTGSSIMTREWERVAALGERVAGGGRFDAPTLRALYTVPSGTVVRRVSVSPWRTDLLDRMAIVAQREGLAGAYVRVGDRFGRIFWRSARGNEYGFQIANLLEAVRDPDSLVVLPEARSRRVLPRSRDRLPD
jgi:hypothetical protein